MSNINQINNGVRHFDLFVEKFFKNNEDHGIKSTTSRIGMKTLSIPVNEDISRLVHTEDIVSKFGTLEMLMEFSYLGAFGHREDECFYGRRPAATLAVSFGEHLAVFQVASAQAAGQDRIVFKMRSLSDDSHEFTFGAGESSFNILLADMIEQAVRRLYGMTIKSEVVPVEPPKDEQAALLASLPAQVNNWIPAEHLGPLAASIANRVKADPVLWLKQGRELGFSTKYLNLNIDQRNGAFVVTGEVTPHLVIQDSYPDHFYPQGWDSSCNLHAGLLKMVLDINKAIGCYPTREQVCMQVAYAGEALQELVSTRNLEIQSRKAITPEQLMQYYGKK